MKRGGRQNSPNNASRNKTERERERERGGEIGNWQLIGEGAGRFRQSRRQLRLTNPAGKFYEDQQKKLQS